ncbi:BREX system Lon protease-like protein BrxL [Clostridium sp. CF012]|uniref:BREX system Lon protease-like protein BrxL n=1 Tax=Clostridium sp. CF012 TaxID=2843319 RepID=UPI001C0C8F89|nr:BREX system Lon protease-like protein BrxL [Clostridium sp. CF012]MBU3145636.1 BREX system Lon protease-like protein BrxL [Clostridium sp. CF012]
MEIWERLLKDNFGSAVVDKPKAIKNEIHGLPRYVSEYLIGFFCEDEITDDGIKETNAYIHKHRIESREKEKFRNELRIDGNIKIIDKFKVKINLGSGKGNKKPTQMEIPSLAINDAEVSDNILTEHPRLLIDGLWGMGEVSYDFVAKDICLTQFKPFQLSDIDVDELVESRSSFDSEQWMNVMISTIGLNFQNYDRREKLILLSRLIPMVENNIFMMEFGSPGTGKTYAYENLSSYSRVISGSKVSAPQLFYNLTTKQDGLLVQYDVLLFDEIDKIQRTGLEDNVNNKLYQYLASGKFDRGGVEKVSECGIMMVGNLPSGYFDKKNLLGDLLHTTNTHSAFLDRLAGVVPGWELKSIGNPNSAYTKNLGFAADYFSEVIHKLRRKNYNYITNKINLKDCSIRDTDAVNKMVSGMIKLVYPDGEVRDEELRELVDLAIEYRQFVIDQNYRINKDVNFDKKLLYDL